MILFTFLLHKCLRIICSVIFPLKIDNGNRTEWSPIRAVIIRVVNKIGRPRSEQTELDETKSCYQLIIKITISAKKKNNQVTKKGKNLH